jgi:hypothetical protein
MSFGAGHSEVSLPDMPWYGDDSGHLLMALLGTDTLNTYVARTGTIASVAAGAASATFTPGTGGSSVTGDVFRIDTGTAVGEVVKPTSIAANVWTMPTTGPSSFRFAHGAAAPVTALAEHTITVLNSAAPPSYTLQKFDKLNSTNARTLAGVYFEEVTIKFSNPGKLTVSAKGRGKMGTNVAAGTAVYSAESFNVPWQTNITIGGVVNIRLTDLEFTLKAPSDQVFGMNGLQSPTAAVADQLSVTGKMTFVPDDYTEYTYYTANTQPALLIEVDNGSNETVFQMSKCAFTDPVVLDHSGNMTMLNATFEAISNSTDAGTGNSPIKAWMRSLNKTTQY